MPAAPEAASAAVSATSDEVKQLTLRQVMLRPRSLATLLAALLVAAVFGLLAQWQLSHAVQFDSTVQRDTETAVPLTVLNLPGAAVTETAAGHRASVYGFLTPADFVVIAERDNNGEVGYWVAGRAQVQLAAGAAENLADLSVAIGWAPTLEAALAAQSRLAQFASGSQQTSQAATVSGVLTGRYNPTENPARPVGEGIYQTLAPSQQLNLWQAPAAQTFGGYLVLDSENVYFAASGLQEIYSPAPAPAEKVNLLNLFYAIEWVLFAGFALYFWVRLCRDWLEREKEIMALSSAI